MEKYIKLNTKSEVIDVFFEYQKNKFDGSEIFIEEVTEKEHKINGKSISNEYGAFIFEYKNKKIVGKTKSNIDKDEKTLKGTEEKETQEKELLIQNKLRQMAIDALIVDGVWTE